MPQFAEFGLIRSIRKWDLVALTVNAVTTQPRALLARR